MKAVQLITVGRPLEEKHVLVPEVGRRDVLVRIRAAGICHSDAHYRNGSLPVAGLPVTLGHEAAGVVEQIGSRVRNFQVGDRVCVHYVATCGECRYCRGGHEQLCSQAEMIGKHRPGGYAEMLVMPESSLVAVPDEIELEHAAVMMCSSATSYHALRKARLVPGERVAVFGCGGLGKSAIQLALIMGAGEVYGVDIRKSILDDAVRLGAVPVDASIEDPVSAIQKRTCLEGVEVSLELTGLREVARQSVRCLSRLGRAVQVGLGENSMEIDTYRELIGKEAEIIGCSDHLYAELPKVLEYARQGRLDLSDVVVERIGLSAERINQTLDNLSGNLGSGRTVIVP